MEFINSENADIAFSPPWMTLSAEPLDKWRKDGSLLENIFCIYEQLPEEARGRSFSWFLKNKQLFEDRKTREQYLQDTSRIIKDAAMQHLEPRDRRNPPSPLLPRCKDEAFRFFMIILQHGTPSPNGNHYSIWREFGFCLCKDLNTQQLLAGVYIELFLGKDAFWDPTPPNNLTCTFKEFWEAHEDGTLVSLMDSKGLRSPREFLNIPHLEAFLGKGAERTMTVWDMKQYLACKDDGSTPLLWFVSIHYGFINCTTALEKRELSELYRRLLSTADPVDLHKACMAGTLFEFASRHFKVEPNLKGLLRNGNTV